MLQILAVAYCDKLGLKGPTAKVHKPKESKHV